MRPKMIYCPLCARELYAVDGKQTIEIVKRCGCGKYFRIDPIRKEAKLVNEPMRTSSSGATFY